MNANKELDLKTSQFKYKVKPIVDQEDYTKTSLSAKRDTKMTSRVTEEFEKETVQEKVEVKHVAKMINSPDNRESRGDINKPNRVKAKEDFSAKSTLYTKVDTSQHSVEAKKDTNIGEHVEEDIQIVTCQMQNRQQSVEVTKGTNIRTSSRPKVEAVRSLRVEVIKEDLKYSVNVK